MITMLYPLSIAFPIALAAVGTGIGQGLIAIKSFEGVSRQPHASTEINKIALLGMMLTETSAILGLVISIFLLVDTTTPLSYEFASLARLGIGCAIGLTSLIAGITSSFPAQAACMSVARQPFFSSKILQLMLITQTVIMTPNIFGFLIALLIHAQVPTIDNYGQGLQLLAAGICIGLGSIGPCIGLSSFAYAACTAIGINRKSYTKIMPFTFICEGIIETPVIFALLISLLILNTHIRPEQATIQGIALISAAFCMSLSTIGTGISAGKVGASACLQIGNNPDHYSMISKIGLLGLAMIDTFAIYGFIVSIILIYAI